MYGLTIRISSALSAVACGVLICATVTLTACDHAAAAGFRSLYSFARVDNNNVNVNGARPSSLLVPAPDGYLYGTTNTGGAQGTGIIFKVHSNGTGIQNLHSFSSVDSKGNNADGANPWALTLGNDGYLYGTTPNAGPNGSGTIFKILTDGTGFQTIHSFSAVDTSGNNADGATPGILTLGTDGILYSVTLSGGINGAGSVFKVHTDGTGFLTLVSFDRITNGAEPSMGLALGTGGYLYGSANRGGTFDGGTLYRVHADGTGFQIIHSFSKLDNSGNNADGSRPGVSIQGPDGSIYGPCGAGGRQGSGTLFKAQADGTGFRDLYTFSRLDINNANPDGASPSGPLTLGVDGHLYGSAGGGRYGIGTLFTIHANGAGFSTLRYFAGPDGAYPSPMIVAPDGKIFGTTSFSGAFNGGTIYLLVPAPPDAPTDLLATAQNAKVALSWTPPATGVAATSYNIYRGTTPGGELSTRINPSPVARTAYTDTGLVNGTTYYYVVESVNIAGIGDRSGEASAKPRPLASQSTSNAPNSLER